MSEIQNRIVCAANRNSLGELVLGMRHFDEFMHQAINAYNISENLDALGEGLYTSLFKFGEQGFLDNRCNFLNRKEAWIVAEAAGQIIRRVGGDTANGGTLFSENLY